MYKAARGTSDILPGEQGYWRYVEEKAAATAERFGYGRIETPAFEDASLFVRTVGQSTDIVEKETYTFEDRGGDLLTLRPEGTAPVCRAYLEHGMHNLPQPVRLYYFCTTFRYDRPQAGRYREFHQFGVEAIGDGDPAVDAEVIELGWGLLSQLGLPGLLLRLNSIGDSRCRPGYIEALKGYYSGLQANLCHDCQGRLERNPLRLLDCKKESCLSMAAQAPRSTDHLCDECKAHWESLQEYLSSTDIPFQVDHHLVRGLDYYSRTVFEVQPPSGGAQSTLLGGGRYDGLIEELGGRPTPGIGFAMGLERVILNLKGQGVDLQGKLAIHFFVAFVGDEAMAKAITLASEIRGRGASALLARPQRSLKGQLRQASALGARYAVILGSDELLRGEVTLRDMESGQQQAQPREEFLEFVDGLSGEG